MQDEAVQREVSRGQVTRGLDDGLSKAFELALTPVILSGLGWLLDARLEVTPLLTLVFFFVGVIGTSISLWARYCASMDAEQQLAADARASRAPRRRASALVPPEGTA